MRTLEKVLCLCVVCVGAHKVGPCLAQAQVQDFHLIYFVCIFLLSHHALFAPDVHEREEEEGLLFFQMWFFHL